MAADSVKEIVSGSKFATIDCSVVQGLSVGVGPMPRAAVGYFAQARATLPHVANSSWQAMCGGWTVSSSARWVAVLLRPMVRSPAGVAQRPYDGALADRARKASNSSARSRTLPQEARRPWRGRFSAPRRRPALDFRYSGDAALLSWIAHRARRPQRRIAPPCAKSAERGTR